MDYELTTADADALDAIDAFEAAYGTIEIELDDEEEDES